MYRNNDTISVLQFIAILIIVIFDVQVLEMPRDLAEAVGPDGWFVLALLTVLAAGLLWCWLRLGSMFPTKGIVGTLQEILGKPMGWGLGAVLLILWLGQTARVARMGVGVVQASLLERTPGEITTIVFLLGALFMARKGVEPLGRMATLVALAALSVAALLPLLTWAETQWLNLRPILQGGIIPELRTTVRLAGRLGGLLIPLILLPMVKGKPKEKKALIPAIVTFVAIPAFVLNLFTLAVFGPRQTSLLLRPGLEVVASIEMPTIFVERLTVFYVGAWTLMIFMDLSIYLYLLSQIAGELFQISESTPLTSFMVPVVYLISRVPANDLAVRFFSKYISWATGAYYLVILGVFLVALIRGFRPQQEGRNT